MPSELFYRYLKIFLVNFILQLKIDSSKELTKKQANLIVYWCSVVKQQFWDRSQALLEFILESKISSNLDIDSNFKQ